MLSPMGEDIAALFDRAGCTGQLCVLSLDGTQQVMVDADRPAVPASVIKVLVALEAETQFAAGQLNPRERVTLRAAERTPGPVLFSLFQDDVRASLRDLVVAMLTISDNVATDALQDRMGPDAVNARAAHLGLAGTVITANLRTIINSIGRDAGFADWDAMWEWAAQPLSAADEQALVSPIATAAMLDPTHCCGRSRAGQGTVKPWTGWWCSAARGAARPRWPESSPHGPACRWWSGTRWTTSVRRATWLRSTRCSASHAGCSTALRTTPRALCTPTPTRSSFWTTPGRW